MQYLTRCQESDCPLTCGWENINHAIAPGCKRFNLVQKHSESGEETLKLIPTSNNCNGIIHQKRCCDCFGQGGKSTCQRKCPCKQAGNKCVSCYPLSKEHCQNSISKKNTISLRQNKGEVSETDLDEDATDEFSHLPLQRMLEIETTPPPILNLVDRKMMEAFGATLTNSDEFDKDDP